MSKERKNPFTIQILTTIHENGVAVAEGFSIYGAKNSNFARKRLNELLNENKDNSPFFSNNINNLLEVLPVVMYLFPKSLDQFKVRRLISPSQKEAAEIALQRCFIAKPYLQVELKQIQKSLEWALNIDDEKKSMAPSGELFRDLLSTLYDLSFNKRAMISSEDKGLYKDFLFGKKSVLHNLSKTIEGINTNIDGLMHCSKEWSSQLDGVITDNINIRY